VRLAWAQRVDTNVAVLEFTKGDGVSTSLPLKSDYGDIYLSLMQVLHAVPLQRPTRWRLETHRYAYRLVDQPDPRTPATIRWEYDREADTKGPPRHHVQSDSKATLGDVMLDLNRAHTPTGWVTIEELLRFLIRDLGVPANSDWPDIVSEGEDKFFEDFTSKRKFWPLRLVRDR
jgi:hypothetical protein